ncbi:hypothetical protein B0H34DRAFT_722560 [Crassisporium funariophilum]|nr:hypothetical protein B0H34DRAFT_722560 [Crassisporium funariophilum]
MIRLYVHILRTPIAFGSLTVSACKQGRSWNVMSGRLGQAPKPPVRIRKLCRLPSAIPLLRSCLFGRDL